MPFIEFLAYLIKEKLFWRFHVGENFLLEYQINGSYEKTECQQVVPSQGFALKHKVGDDGENNKADAFLDDLKLDKGEWTSVAYEADTVGRNLAAILEEGDGP